MFLGLYPHSFHLPINREIVIDYICTFGYARTYLDVIKQRVPLTVEIYIFIHSLSLPSSVTLKITLYQASSLLLQSWRPHVVSFQMQILLDSPRGTKTAALCVIVGA